MVQKHFDSIGMDVFDDAEMVGPKGKPLRVKHFAKREGAGFTPTLLFLDTKGERMLRVVGYHSPQRFRHVLDYVIDEHYRTLSLAAYLKRATKPPDATTRSVQLQSDPLFRKPPHDLQRRPVSTEKPMVVLFEKPDCEECTTFHKAVLAVDEVRQTLRRFDVFRLNIEDAKTPLVMPDGRKTTAAEWFEKTGFTRVPALVFFEEKGKQVLETASVVLRQRMMNSVGFVLERAYEKGWSYQRFARSQAIKRMLKSQKK